MWAIGKPNAILELPVGLSNFGILRRLRVSSHLPDSG
jgi:hypothetical protein